MSISSGPNAAATARGPASPSARYYRAQPRSRPGRVRDEPHANKLTIHILAAVAEHERELISARTKESLAAAKARGVKLGGPKQALAAKRGAAANKEAADAFAANVVPIIRQVKASGATSLRAVAAALTARGIPTPRGREWSAPQVANVLKRAEA